MPGYTVGDKCWTTHGEAEFECIPRGLFEEQQESLELLPQVVGQQQHAQLYTSQHQVTAT